MKNIALQLILSSILLTGCAARNVVTWPKAPEISSDVAAKCMTAFPPTPVQLVHYLNIKTRDGSTRSYQGILSIEPQRKILRVTILSLQGVIWLDVESTDGEIRTFRAPSVPDNAEFVKGLFHDLKFWIIAPTGTLKQARQNAEGHETCTWEDENGGVLFLTIGHGRRTFEFRPSRLAETGRTVQVDITGEPESIDAFKLINRAAGYELSGDLIDASPLDPESGAFEGNTMSP